LLAPLFATVLLIVVDDLGHDDLARVDTPNMDRIAATGVSFTNAWSAPVCGPSRSMIMTGRFPTRTGMGDNPISGPFELRDSETTLAELVGFGHALGKWHLGMRLNHPARAGFNYYAGSRHNVPDYYLWPKNDNGFLVWATRHATLDVLHEALQNPSPFLYVSFNAPHKPYHIPPGETDATRGALIHHLDGAIGRLLAAYPRALVILVSDNGALMEGPEGKGSFYETGINVPLAISGPGVTHGTCDALVNLTDLHATVGELFGATSMAEDSLSLMPYLTDPSIPSLRQYNFSERFTPSGFGPRTDEQSAIRDVRHKLIRVNGGERFYDLLLDPGEDHPLPLSGADYIRLSRKMDDWFL